jgi:maltose alpha-D-glucosyltransferase/alpha-amylase
LNFLLSQHLFLAFAEQRAEPVARVLKSICDAPQNGQWVNFLRNLDELNLAKLSTEERELVFDRFAPEADMRLYNRGIRRRTAPMFGGDRQRLELAYSLLFSLPGSPLIMYGDEIGLGENLALWERNSVRTPMQWSSGLNGGFSTVSRESLVRPVTAEGPFGYRTVNVERQHDDPDSLLNWMRKLILIRRSSPEIGWQRCEVFDGGHPAVFAQRSQWKEGELLIAHNLSGDSVEATLTLERRSVRHLVTILGEARHAWADHGHCHLSLGPYGYVWYRIERTAPEMPSPQHIQGAVSTNGAHSRPEQKQPERK